MDGDGFPRAMGNMKRHVDSSGSGSIIACLPAFHPLFQPSGYIRRVDLWVIRFILPSNVMFQVGV